MSPRPLLFIAAVIVGAVGASLAIPSRSASLEIRYRYLLVEAIGPPEWVGGHAFSVRWRNKDLSLPVVFRVADPLTDFKMGSGGEVFGHLVFGNRQAPVSVTPDTKFQVRNTGITAFIREKDQKKQGVVVVSFASSVAVSPPEHPGELSPVATEEEQKSATLSVQTRIQKLIASGDVCDVEIDSDN
jgi:hypothetical protein